jgi:hypothetical protein
LLETSPDRAVFRLFGNTILDITSGGAATATNFPSFPKENIRARCNQHKVRGMQVNYKAAEKYTGKDEFDLLVLYPGGFGQEVHLNINVR